MERAKSVKRQYELTFIVRNDPNEEVIEDTISEVKGWVEADDYGTVTKIDRWGRRKLAYEIDKQREGYYVLMHADLDPEGINELEHNMGLSQSVLRFLLIRSED